MPAEPRCGGAPSTRPVVIVEPSAGAAAVAAYCRVRGALESAAALRGDATFAFSGGTTPQAAYATWAERAGSAWPVWSRLRVFQVDERAVPQDHEWSNWRHGEETFLRFVAPERLERMRGEAEDLEAEALRYAERLRAGTGSRGGAPTLDAILLGVGEDGHTASLFPRAAALRADDPVVVAEAGQPPYVRRLTLTPAVLASARAVIVLATGERKAPAVRGALEEAGSVEALPARLLAAAGRRVTWILDREAAARLS